MMSLMHSKKWHIMLKGIIAWGDDEHLRKIEADVPIYYYGFKDSDDIYAQNIQITDKGTAFDVYVDGEFYDHFCLHNMVTIQF